MSSGKKRKKKKGFGYYLYAVFALLFLVADLCLGTLVLFHVESVTVTGCGYGSKEEILSELQEDPYTVNALYLLWKVQSGSYHKPSYLETVTAKLKLPWKVELQLQEKEMIGCAPKEEQYVCFDEEGFVVQITDEKPENIPVIEGIDTDHSELYQVLEGDYKYLFRSVVLLTEELQASDLVPDRLVWEDDSMNAYFAKVCVRFGKTGYEDKVLQYLAIREKLVGEDGVLHLEHYGDTNKSISFEKNY